MNNLKKVAALINGFKKEIPEELTQKVVIFGSSCAVLNGVNLGREIDDLDLFVDKTTYQKFLSYDVTEIEKVPGVFALKFNKQNIEILTEFPGVSFRKAKSASKRTKKSGLLMFGSIKTLTDWKKGQIAENPRPKDYADLAVLKKALPNP